ncbi:MAG: PTS sugar transporter [Candidatus Eisenbacteria bacterium]|nr:PTS sugar transporter [Candidatus Eisenbacteria bacterium]
MSAGTQGPAGGAPDTSTVPALLVMHADLAEALLHAAAAVYGPIEGIEVLSNSGLSREALEARIAEQVTHWRHGGLVLTDFWGGSCHTCGLKATRGRGEILLLTGVNLPVLLDYLHNRDRFTASELAERLQTKGRESIRAQRCSES